MICGLSPAAEAQSATNALPDLSLEQLLNIEVTSVSKKEQNLFDAPAAISVLSNDDLRRSGATSVAEALRLVPGLDVAQASSSEWAISSRGFNNVYANKLLVLVDGRAVYTPLFSGVFWDLQQTMLEDVDRIEVIRGPGATLWGANAVDGVINVETRSARDTQGLFSYAGGGYPHEAMAGSRYGGQLGDDTFYRVFGSYQLNGDFELINGKSAADNWQGGQGGCRLDRYPQAETHLTWQGDVTANELYDRSSDAYNVNTLGRWTRTYSERASLEAQVYFDRTERSEAARVGEAINTLDLSLQHNFGIGERNDVVWGLGYRLIGNEVWQTTPNVTVKNEDFTMQLFNAFVQDEFKIVPDKFSVSVGTKIEHNDVTGFEFQPSIRATFKPEENQTLWASISRAVRTPNELEARNVLNVALGGPEPGPGGGLYVPTLVGGANLKSEVLWAYELGYRIQPVKSVSVDLATFYNDYSHIIGFGPVSQFNPGSPAGTADIPWANTQNGSTWGGELSVTYSPFAIWRLTASYSLLEEHVHDIATGAPHPDPEHQALLRSSYDLTRRISLDGQLRYVAKLADEPAYATADARIAYRPTKNIELSLVGQNLFQPRHVEEGPTPLVPTAEVPRGFYGKITWKF